MFLQLKSILEYDDQVILREVECFKFSGNSLVSSDIVTEIVILTGSVVLLRNLFLFVSAGTAVRMRRKKKW